ncbi:MAG: hypothetical protein JST00_04315 [Deltaproteobacteria bacterium]|nr:hypothetical protein [Deltaproteobacteria bacterium]
MQTAPETPAHPHPGEGLDAREVLPALRSLVRLRLLSSRMVDLQRAEAIASHSACLGEEAAIVGAVMAAREQDWVFPGSREWGAAIVRGLPIATYVHHAFGSSLDPAKGHAAPDHPPARRVKVAPSSGIAAAHLTQAVGAAWAAKIAKDGIATLALFGEGALGTGDFHHAVNFAGVFKAPCVFVCRRDGRKPGGPRAASSDALAEKAVAYGVASAKVDGADLAQVLAAAREAFARALDGRGPTLVEVTTTPVDPAAFDAATDRLAIGDGDPVARLRRVLERDKLVDAAAFDALVRETKDEIEAAIVAAKSAAPLPASSLFDDVYSELPAHLRAQKESVA